MTGEEESRCIRVKLTRGKFAFIDAEDMRLVIPYVWFASENHAAGGFYAVRSVGGDERAYMHRELMGVADPAIRVDHRNLDSLDNRRLNLRTCTHSEKQWRYPKPRTNTSGIKGVSAIDGKWVAFISVHGKVINLGRFEKIEEAAEAYKAASLRYHGAFGRTA
jgi:hypothetical protein